MRDRGLPLCVYGDVRSVRWEDGLVETNEVRLSFAELYRVRFDAMVRLAYVLTAGSPAAEELVQDAFERLHRRWDTVEEPVSYLRVAVVNACTSWRRRAVLERRWAAGPRVTSTAEHQPDGLREAIARLPTRQRAAVVLRYYEDLPEAEIATILGCRIPAVKSLLHRALTTLREVTER